MNRMDSSYTPGHSALPLRLALRALSARRVFPCQLLGKFDTQGTGRGQRILSWLVECAIPENLTLIYPYVM